MGRLRDLAMAPLFDLIVDRHGELDTERIEAIDSESAWRSGLLLHLGTLKGVVVQVDDVDRPQGDTRPLES